jgi:DNA-binding LacI/PurR family transcriptional regulator
LGSVPAQPGSDDAATVLPGGAHRRRPRHGSRKPSITDVARLAGVSYQTVSRVINDLPDVSPTTRERVLGVIEQVGYRRNRAATTLVTNRSTFVGILTDGSPRFGPVGTLIALESAAREAGYGATVVTVSQPYGRTVRSAFLSLEDAGVDGIIAIVPRLALASAVREAHVGVPLEMIAAGEPATPPLFSYSENQELGARMATEHLIGLGHRDIAHLGGSTEWFDGRVRKRGWESALRDAGLTPGVYAEGDWSPKWAFETGLRLIREGLPQAIFAASDHTALGLYRAFAENGVRVPQDVSVVGYDDIEGSDYFAPPLTTVRQDFTGVARHAIELLLAAIDGRAVDSTPTLPVLQVRASTAPPRRGAAPR